MSPHPRPRPILKRQLSPARQPATPALPFATCGAVLSPHVHFPPTPRLVASTHPVHSPRTYDRKPIVISPNSCDLPSRHDRKLYSPPADFEVEPKERGRSRSKEGSAGVKGSYFHPRAFEACEPEQLDDDTSLSPPPLLARRSSYSDDSDSESDSDDSDVVMTPPDHKLAGSAPQIQESMPSPPPNHLSSYSSHIAGLRRAAQVEEKPRPHLLRANKQPSIIAGRELVMGLDEGCLGGF